LPDTIAPAARKRAVRPRHAASLIVVRETRNGPEMLMGMRGSRHRFMPNVLVFPGGRVDRADHRAPFATPLREETRALLERSAPPRLAQSLALAAARELEEETGLHLASQPGGLPELDGLHYLCRAVTPPSQHMRFNARFLVVEAERITGTLAGSGELESLAYYVMDEVLRSSSLAGITRGVLENLQRFLAMDPATRDSRAAVPINLRDIWRME